MWYIFKKKQSWKKHFEPEKEFLEKTKAVFLSAVRERYPVRRPARGFALRYVVRGLALGVVVVFIVSGGAVFADEVNVGPTHILYSLKRSQEKIKLVLADETERPILHLEYAERRLEEVERMKSVNPGSERIGKLVQDLREEMVQSFVAIGNGEPAEEEMEVTIEQRKSGESIKKQSVEEEDEDEEIIERAPAMIRKEEAAPGGTPGAQPMLREEDKEKNVEKEKSEEKKGKLFQKAVPAAKQNGKNLVPICRSFNGILKSRLQEVQKIVDDYPEFLEKFERQCVPLVQE